MAPLRGHPLVDSFALACVFLVLAGCCQAEDEWLIRRVAITPEQLPALLRRQPELVTVPVDQFESALGAARRHARSSAAALMPQAVWRARLEGDLLVGQVEWKWPEQTAPGRWVLDDWRLALREPPPNQEGSPWFGEIAPGGPTVWLREPGPRTLVVKWSVRGEVGPDGAQFELPLPASAVGSLELTLPRSRDLSLIGDRALASSAVVGDARGRADERTWVIPLGSAEGRRLRVLVHPPAPQQPTASSVVEVHGDFTLNPTEALFVCTWDLEWPSAPPMELQVSLADGVEVSRIRQRLRDMYVSLAYSRQGVADAQELVVALPARRERRLQLEVEGSLRPSTTGNAGSDYSLALPIPSKAVVVRESLLVRGQPALDLTPLETNGFRVLPAEPNGRKANSEGDRGWRCARDGLRRDSSRGPLRVRLTPALGALSARQSAFWLLAVDRSTWRVQTALRARGGPVYGADLELPPDFEPETITTVPAGALREWHVRRQGERQVLHLEPAAPLVPGNPLHVDVQGRGPGWSTAAHLPRTAIPGADPAGYVLQVRLREPTARRQLVITHLTGHALAPGGAPASPLWRGEPDAWLAHSGAPPSGRIEVHASSTPIRVTARTTVDATASRIGVEHVLDFFGDVTAIASAGFHWTEDVRGCQWFIQDGTGQRPIEPRLERRADANVWTTTFHLGSKAASNTRLRGVMTMPREDSVQVPLLGGSENAHVRATARVRGGSGTLEQVETSIPIADDASFAYVPGAARLIFHASPPSSASDDRVLIHLESRGSVSNEGSLRVRVAAEAWSPGEGNHTVSLTPSARGVRVLVNGLGCPTTKNENGVTATLPLTAGRNDVLLEWDVPPESTWWWARQFDATGPCWNFPHVIVRCQHSWDFFDAAAIAWPPLALDDATLTWRPLRWPWDFSTEPPQAMFLLVTPAWAPHLAGLALAVTVLLVLRTPLRALAVLIAATLLTFVTSASLHPALAWPALTGVLILMRSRFSPIFARKAGQRPWPNAPGLAALLIALLAPFAGLAFSLGAPADEPPKVAYVVMEVGQEKAAVLLPPTLWQRLQAAAASEPQDPPGHLVLGGKFVVTARNEVAVVDATVLVRALQSGAVSVDLPRIPGRLRQVTLDDAPAVVAAGAENGGFSVIVQAAGPHAIRLTWETDLKRQGAGRTCTLDLPSFAFREVEVQLPSTAHHVRVDGFGGGHVIENKAAGVVVKGFLQRGDQPVISWHEGPPAPAVARAQAAYLWELTPSRAQLQAVFDLAAGQGALTSLAFAVPDELVLLHVDVRGERGSILRGWELAHEATGQMLRLTLAGPQLVPVRVRLDCLLNPPTARHGPPETEGLRLPVPRPVGVEPAGRVVGLRVSDLKLANVEPGTDWLNINPARARELGWPSDLGAPQYLDGIWEARAAEPQPITARLAAEDRFEGAVQLDVWVNADPDGLHVETTLRLDAPQSPVLELTCQLPPGCVVHDARGVDLWQWRQLGSVLHVYFKKPVTTATIHLSGSLAHSRGPQGSVELEWPVFLVNGRPTATRVLARPRPRWGWEMVDAQGVRVLPEDGLTAEGTEPRRLRLRRVESVPEARVRWTQWPTFPGSTIDGRIEFVNWPYGSGGATLLLESSSKFKTVHVDGPGLISIRRRQHADGQEEWRMRWAKEPAPIRIMAESAESVGSTSGTFPRIAFAPRMLTSVEATSIATEDEAWAQPDRARVLAMTNAMQWDDAGWIRHDVSWLVEPLQAQSLAIALPAGALVESLRWNRASLTWDRQAGGVVVTLPGREVGLLAAVIYQPASPRLSTSGWPRIVTQDDYPVRWSATPSSRFRPWLRPSSTSGTNALARWDSAWQARAAGDLDEYVGRALAPDDAATPTPPWGGLAMLPEDNVTIEISDLERAKGQGAFLATLLAAALLAAGGLTSAGRAASGVCWLAAGFVMGWLSGFTPLAFILFALGGFTLMARGTRVNP